MRIAINARSILLANRTGIGRYTYHLVDSLGNIDQTNKYWLYVRKNFFDQRRSLPRFSHSRFKIKNDFLNSGLTRSLKGADVYHSPSPDSLDIQDCKIVVTIHDLIYKTFPQSHTQETIDSTETQMQQIVKKADRIICASKSTLEDFHRFFDFPREKSSVVYNGVDHQTFYPLSFEEKSRAKDNLKQKGIQKPFILYVGTIEPRKNLTGLLQVFAEILRKKRFDGQLVVVGMKGWKDQSIEPLIEKLGIKENVQFLGFVPDEQLRILYNLAEVFVFPSFYEGFGFPIVEAFSCGAAVVTSSTSSCGEIANEAALTIDPNSDQQLAGAITKLLEDKNLNQEFRLKGLQRAKDFSFEKTARETLKVYESFN